MTNAHRALRDYERSLNMSNNTANASATIAFPFATLAVAVMAVLKIAGMQGASWGLANLSWWWVFSPWLFAIAFTVAMLVLFGIVAAVALGVADLMDRRTARKRAKRGPGNRGPQLP